MRKPRQAASPSSWHRILPWLLVPAATLLVVQAKNALCARQAHRNHSGRRACVLASIQVRDATGPHANTHTGSNTPQNGHPSIIELKPGPPPEGEGVGVGVGEGKGEGENIGWGVWGAGNVSWGCWS